MSDPTENVVHALIPESYASHGGMEMDYGQDLDTPGKVNKHRRRFSQVWNYFTQDATKSTVRCKHCDWQNKFSGSTSCMHGHANTCKAIAAIIAATENMEESFPPRGQVRLFKEKNDGPAKKKVRKSILNANHEKLRYSVYEMLLIDKLPYSILDGKGFNALIRSLQHTFPLPSASNAQQDIEEAIVPTYKNAIQNMLLQEIARGTKFHIACNAVYHDDSSAFLVVQIHYIDSSWTLVHYYLNYEVLSFPITPQGISEVLMKTLQEFNLVEHVLSLLLDDHLLSFFPASTPVATVGANSAYEIVSGMLRKAVLSSNSAGQKAIDEMIIGKAMIGSLLEELVKGCYAAVDPIISKLRTMLHFYILHESKFEEHVDSLLPADVKQLDRPIVDNPLQWNSTYTMIAKVLPFYPVFDQYPIDFAAVNAAALAASSAGATGTATGGNKRKGTKATAMVDVLEPIVLSSGAAAATTATTTPALATTAPAVVMISTEEWQTIHDVKQLLETLLEFYYYISSQELPTIHNGIVTIHDLESYLTEQVNHNNLLIQQLANGMLLKLQTQYQELLPKEHVIGQILDPRLKLVYAQEFLATPHDTFSATGKPHPFGTKNIVEEFKNTLFAYVTGHYNQTQDSLLSLVKPMHVTPMGFVPGPVGTTSGAVGANGLPGGAADSDSENDELANGGGVNATQASVAVTDALTSSPVTANSTSSAAAAAATVALAPTSTTASSSAVPSQMKFFQLMRERTKAAAYSHSIEDELDHYFKEDTVPFDANPEAYNILDWWKLNALRYPRLAMMAKHLLSIPLTVNCFGEQICTNVIVKSVTHPIPACVQELSASPTAVKYLILGQSWLDTYKRYNWAIPILPKLSA